MPASRRRVDGADGLPDLHALRCETSKCAAAAWRRTTALAHARAAPPPGSRRSPDTGAHGRRWASGSRFVFARSTAFSRAAVTPRHYDAGHEQRYRPRRQHVERERTEPRRPRRGDTMRSEARFAEVAGRIADRAPLIWSRPANPAEGGRQTCASTNLILHNRPRPDPRRAHPGRRRRSGSPRARSPRSALHPRCSPGAGIRHG